MRMVSIEPKYDYAFGWFGYEGQPKVIICEYDWICREYVRLRHLELHEEQLIRCSGRKKILKSSGHYDQRLMKTHCFALIRPAIFSPLSSRFPAPPLGWWLGWLPWNFRQLHPLLSLHCFKFGRTKYTLRLGKLWWIFQRSLVSEEGRLKGETWKLYPWRVSYRPKMSQMRYAKSIYIQMVECFVFCLCMSVCALFGIGSCLLVNVFDTSKLWDYAFESLTLRRLWLLFFLFAHESNMQVMIVSEHEPIVSMIVYNGINCLNWIAKTYVR